MTAVVGTRSGNVEDRESAIRLDSVSVRYRVPHERIWSVKEYVIRRVQRRVTYTDHWALRDIDLTIARGDVFGIVGANGAGKSTLLKLIARVMSPTKGRVRVRGRVAPLIEVGAGFHPELTGRENVYLNAMLLGRARPEIDAAFEAIVEFSGLHEFIDAPLRTYSTGMWARLGFSVATAWQPDILLLDEVLAVGDYEFKVRCQRRIAEFRADGATTILVSHDLAAVDKTCESAIWIDQGQVRAAGRAAEITAAYRAGSDDASAVALRTTG